VLAQLARAAARRKISQLEEALEGAEFFTDDHAALLAKVLARTGRLSAGIEDLTAVTGRLLARYEEQLQQAESMPGWARRAAQDAVAETGAGRAGSAPGRTCPPGAAAPRKTTSPASAPDAPKPRKATSTSARSSARPPWRPAAPRPAKASATAGWPEDAARPKPASPPGTPS
jgi:hypothetical protein